MAGGQETSQMRTGRLQMKKTKKKIVVGGFGRRSDYKIHFYSVELLSDTKQMQSKKQTHRSLARVAPLSFLLRSFASRKIPLFLRGV